MAKSTPAAIKGSLKTKLSFKSNVIDGFVPLKHSSVECVYYGHKQNVAIIAWFNYCQEKPVCYFDLFTSSYLINLN